jgi:hypothetical protein
MQCVHTFCRFIHANSKHETQNVTSGHLWSFVCFVEKRRHCSERVDLLLTCRISRALDYQTTCRNKKGLTLGPSEQWAYEKNGQWQIPSVKQDQNCASIENTLAVLRMSLYLFFARDWCNESQKKQQPIKLACPTFPWNKPMQFLLIAK